MELRERIEASDAKEKKVWFMIGWAVSQIVSYLVGKPIAISDLLPEMFPAKVWTKAEIKKELIELKRMLKIKD